MYCKNCGQEVDETVMFCPKCAAPINGTAKNIAQEAAVSQMDYGIHVTGDFEQLRQVTEKSEKFKKFGAGHKDSFGGVWLFYGAGAVSYDGEYLRRQ